MKMNETFTSYHLLYLPKGKAEIVNNLQIVAVYQSEEEAMEKASEKITEYKKLKGMEKWFLKEVFTTWNFREM